MSTGAKLSGRGPGFLPAIVRWALGAIFLAAGIVKIAHPGNFYSDLLAYELALPDFGLRLVAVAFPWLEALCGAALLAGFWTETVGGVVAAMCLVFVLALGEAVLRGLDLHCGCFGVAAAGWFDRPDVALVRAVVLLLGALWLWKRTSSGQSD